MCFLLIITGELTVRICFPLLHGAWGHIAVSPRSKEMATVVIDATADHVPIFHARFIHTIRTFDFGTLITSLISRATSSANGLPFAAINAIDPVAVLARKFRRSIR